MLEQPGLPGEMDASDETTDLADPGRPPRGAPATPREQRETKAFVVEQRDPVAARCQGATTGISSAANSVAKRCSSMIAASFQRCGR